MDTHTKEHRRVLWPQYSKAMTKYCFFFLLSVTKFIPEAQQGVRAHESQCFCGSLRSRGLPRCSRRAPNLTWLQLIFFLSPLEEAKLENTVAYIF